MRPTLLLRSIWLMALFTCTTLDQPLEEVKESDSESDSSVIDWDSYSFKDEQANLRNSTTNKWNHSRMLMKTSTTLKFPEWWFFTTRRPIISYKDYPGKPGVATWKEISPTENRSSRKLKNPTAEQVSSCALCPSSDLRHFMVYAIVGTLIGLYHVR
ncbi:uncharacterized protein LOC129961032 [Argiope bruennichi]|uniref:Uncharacterized protein n=1 Tax=Argiope bruennichi TaxID=94029 RepID=A0A8T0FIU2_ARGBR|nr:uncharacterized protein LOC129961032 [Argiope bruennichi]KAF8790911.1 hypothetical protein HNY73_005856 [Argiope bruennichi]